MMSKEEVKREYKEDEGDPNIKHQREHLHRQLLSENMVRNVPKADAVVVNPTHLAIALQYDQSRMAAPLVTAKGQLLMAQKIVQVAKRHRVPWCATFPWLTNYSQLRSDSRFLRISTPRWQRS
jgi:flagellar biosynthesis protein FlhB